MDGEIYTRTKLEGMDEWRATLRHLIAQASPLDRLVCLMKNPGKKPGYFWKMPGLANVEAVNLDRLQRGLDDGRLELVKGTLPQGIIGRKSKKKKARKKVKVDLS